jgi:hypothetical protein
MYGLAVQSECPLVGCPQDAAPGLPPVVLEPREVAPASGRALTWRAAGVPDLLKDPAGGYFLEAPGLAAFHVSAGGDTVGYHAQEGPDWRWQRYLLGRVLPLAATLLGREPLHASAVACGKGAVLLAGESRSGKTTLAAELMLEGLDFMADDVVALSLRDGRPLAHPGPGLMSLRRPYGIGETVGSDRDCLWVAVERAPQALPVSAIYLLSPDAPPGISHLTVPEPAALLAAGFTQAIRDPARLIRQLDVCAALAGARVARVGVRAGADFRALAATLLSDMYGWEAAA